MRLPSGVAVKAAGTARSEAESGSAVAARAPPGAHRRAKAKMAATDRRFISLLPTRRTAALPLASGVGDDLVHIDALEGDHVRDHRRDPLAHGVGSVLRLEDGHRQSRV